LQINSENMTLSWRDRIRWFFATILIRLKKINRVDVSASEMNHLMGKYLPQSYQFDIPSGSGQLSILQATLSISQSEPVFNIELYGSFEAKIRQKTFYRTHLHVFISTKPVYHADKELIQLIDLKIIDIVLVDDEFALMKDTRALMGKLVPSSFKSLFSVTLKTGLGIVNSTSNSDLVQYLSLYLTGNRQLIIDYHRHQIENKLSQLAKNDSFCYKLNPMDFEERLFAQYGQSIEIEDGILYFVFNKA